MPKQVTHHVTERDYERKLREVVDTIFEVNRTILGWSFNQLATEAGLAQCTVWRLAGRMTSRPQFRTVFRVAKAVGMDLYAAEELGIKRKGRKAS
jgi:DNA-binding phage protein